MTEEYQIRLTIEELENGQFLATSEELTGLVAQGRTISETSEIARDVARKLLDSYIEHGDPIPPGFKKVQKKTELDVAVGI